MFSSLRNRNRNRNRNTDFSTKIGLLKQDEDVLLTDKQIERLNKKQEKSLEDELRLGMIEFRRYVLKSAGSRKKLLSKGQCSSWEEFVMTSIFYINNDYSFDIDSLRGVSDYFLSELHNENTKLTWTSYSHYYERMSKSKTIRSSKKSSLDEFFK